jgi:hypothetical protein
VLALFAALLTLPLQQSADVKAQGVAAGQVNSVHKTRTAPPPYTTQGTAGTNGIDYHGGPVMLGTTNIYYIWYGNWTNNSGVQILTDFAKNVGGALYFNVNTTYFDSAGNRVSNSVRYAGSTNDNYSRGTVLSDGDIQAIVSDALTGKRLPIDVNGVYYVLTSADVAESSGFCTKYCGWHNKFDFSSYLFSDSVVTKIKYSFVGNPDRCLSACAAQTVSPNGNAGADAMVSIIAHELDEAVTDPYFDAWYDSVGNENADKCAWQFGATYRTPNGAQANMWILGRDYLIQQNWVNANRGSCEPLLPPERTGGNSGFLIQSNYKSNSGGKGDFQLVVPSASSGLAHYWRENNTAGLPWRGPVIFGQDLGHFDAVSLIQSNFSAAGNGPGNLELVGRVGTRLVGFQHPDNGSGWFPSTVPQVSIAGNPALIQSRFGTKGNFELVVPLASGGLAHYWRENDTNGLPWRGPVIFGQDLGYFDSVSLIQSNFGAGRGNLEIIARQGNRLVGFWREYNANGSAGNWLRAAAPTVSVAGNPALIQGRFGARGNFELVVPLTAGGLGHFWRNNDASGLPWLTAATFGQEAGYLNDVSLVQSNFSEAGNGRGNLELVGRAGNRLVAYWHPDNGGNWLPATAPQ